MTDETFDSPANAQFLRDAFALEQEWLAIALRSSARIGHHGDRGEVNEQHFIDFLRQYLPNRYTVDKAMVLDSLGATSHSIDIVVYDRQYTPALLDNKKHRYVPAEAVYAVFECKQTIDKRNLEYAGEKIASVRRLHRTSVDIHHAGGVFRAKPLFDIVGGILAAEVGWSDDLGATFETNHRAITGDRLIDCGFTARGACFDTFGTGGIYTFGPERNALAFFAFRLLWKLQTLATVPAVDWMAYADRLSSGPLRG